MVVVGKHLFQTVFYQEVTIVIHSVAQVIHIHANVIFDEKKPEEEVLERAHAIRVLANNLFSIEVRDSFTAHIPRKHILMRVN